MAKLSNINGKFAVEDTGAIRFSDQTGTTGQILKSNGNSAPTWVDPNTVGTGPWLPLAGGIVSGATTFQSSLTVGGALTVDGIGTFNTPSGGVAFNVDAFTDGYGVIRFRTNGNASKWDVGINSSNHFYIGNNGVNTALEIEEVSSNATFAGTLQSGNFAIGVAPSSFGTGVPTITLRGTAANGRGGAIMFQEQDGTVTTNIYSTDGADGYGTVINAAQSNFKVSVGALAATQLTISSTTATFAGSVGIGGGTIEGKLSIDYTAAELPTSGTTSNSAIQVTSSLNNQLNLGLNTVSGDYGAYIQASDNNLAVPYPLNLQPNGGNVGIGTTSPGARLETKAANTGATTDYSTKVIKATAPLIGGYTGTKIISLLSGFDGGIHAVDFGYGYNTVGYDIMLSTNDNTTGDPIERMRITSRGEVGIGITPNVNSNVVNVIQLGKGMTLLGNANDDRATMAANLYLDTGTAFRYVMDGYAGRFSIEDGNMIWGTAGSGTLGAVATVSTKMTLLNNGNVGIGVTPTQKLDVDGQMTHDGLVMKSGDGVYIDRYLAYTISISLISFNWVDTGIYSNSGSYQLGASGTYAVQIYSDSHAGEPYWYNAYWSGIMSWYQGSSNQNGTFEIPLTTAAHSTNGRTLELRIQNTLSSGPGTPVNNARLEVKTTAAGTNNVTLYFRFRRLI